MTTSIVLFVLAFVLFLGAFGIKYAPGPGAKDHQTMRAGFAARIIATGSVLCLLGAIVALKFN